MTMNRLVLLLIFILIGIPVFCQVSFPGVSDHPEWNVQRSIEPFMPGPVFMMSYHLEKDTLINQKTYSQVTRTCNQEPLLSSERIGFIRSDAKTVFFRKTAKGKEYVLYDFGLRVGDKVYCPYFDLDSAEYHVLAVDSVELNGIKHKRLKVRPEDYYIDFPFVMDWIEGIGNLENPFYADVFAVSGSSDEVRCVSTDAGLLYSNPRYADCISVLQKTDCLVNEGVVWSGMTTFRDSSGKDSISSYHIKFSGDTILNDKTYLKIWQSDDSLGVGWKLTGLIREVEKRVYYHFLNYDSYADLLLYDFSVQAGNSLLLSSVENGGHYEQMKVTKVDSIEINGKRRLRIQLSDGTDNDTWIEKIGSLQGIINHCYFEPVRKKRILLCVQENGNAIYTNETYPECYYSRDIIEKATNLRSELKMKVFPNPFCNELNLVFPARTEGDVNVEFYTVNGELVYYQCFDSGVEHFRLDLEFLKSGIYILRLKSVAEYFEDKLLIKI